MMHYILRNAEKINNQIPKADDYLLAPVYFADINYSDFLSSVAKYSVCRTSNANWQQSQTNSYIFAFLKLMSGFVRRYFCDIQFRQTKENWMRDLTSGKESKLIVSFATPLIIGGFFQQFYNVVDSIIVGKFLGKEALAAVGASFPFIFLLISLVVGIANGATIIISQYYGAKRYDSVNKAIQTNNIFLLISSIILATLGILFCEKIFEIIDLPEDVMPQATTYLKVYLLGLPGLFGYYGMSGILRGLGDSKTPLYVLIISSLANIVLDILFVAGFNWGVTGAALATIVSQVGTFLGLSYYLNKTHELIKVSLINLSFDKEIFKKSVTIGLPSGLQQAFVGLGNMAILSIVTKFGTAVVAAYTVAGRIDMLALLPTMNIATALSTFVGQNIGANKLDRVKRGVLATAIMGIIVSAIISLIIMLFSEQLMMLFVEEAEVIKIGSDYLMIVASFYICFSMLFVSNGALRGAGDTIIPMFITLLSLWVIRIPISYYLSLDYGYRGIWWGIPAAWITGMLFSGLYFFSGRWKRKAVIKYDK